LSGAAGGVRTVGALRNAWSPNFMGSKQGGEVETELVEYHSTQLQPARSQRVHDLAHSQITGEAEQHGGIEKRESRIGREEACHSLDSASGRLVQGVCREDRCDPIFGHHEWQRHIEEPKQAQLQSDFPRDLGAPTAHLTIPHHGVEIAQGEIRLGSIRAAGRKRRLR
jgi:hypothetical protein